MSIAVLKLGKDSMLLLICRDPFSSALRLCLSCEGMQKVIFQSEKPKHDRPILCSLCHHQSIHVELKDNIYQLRRMREFCVNKDLGSNEFFRRVQGSRIGGHQDAYRLTFIYQTKDMRRVVSSQRGLSQSPTEKVRVIGAL